MNSPLGFLFARLCSGGFQANFLLFFDPENFQIVMIVFNLFGSHDIFVVRCISSFQALSFNNVSLLKSRTLSSSRTGFFFLGGTTFQPQTIAKSG